MEHDTRAFSPVKAARLAGLLYLVIIVLGIAGEVLVRSSLIVQNDPGATAANIMAAGGLFRFGFVTDSVMFLSDVALAVLLFVLLRPVGPVLSLMAMVFRLAQTAVIAMNLLNYHAAGMLLGNPVYGAAFGEREVQALALFRLDLHAHGYDLGLILFGVHCLLLGVLVVRSRYFPRFLGFLLMAAAVVYLVGSYTRFLFPEALDALAPIYLVAVVSEVSLCLWLLIKGVNLESWKRRVAQSV
jgi:hypothetical protein